MSKDYDKDAEISKFIKARMEKGKKPLTRTQYEFIEWLFEEENMRQITKVGNLPGMFKEIWKHTKGL